MNLIFGNKIISTSIKQIIMQLKIESGGYYFDQIQDKGDYLRVTCPFHKNGHELNPSCSIYQRTDNDNIQPGTLHCFTCGKKCQLYTVVSHCLDLNNDQLGEEWLVERFGQIFDSSNFYLPELEIGKQSNIQFLDDSLLDGFDYNNVDTIKYLTEIRKLSEAVIQKFRIGYNSKTNSITFPTWSMNNKLVGVFERSLKTKKFNIPSDIDKPVYLLNYIVNHHITKVYIVESCINALTLWGWDRPAVALFGTGTQKQYDILKKSGIRHYILCFDGDDAGYSGAQRFLRAMNDDVITDNIIIPHNKDINDLTKEEFLQLEKEFT